MAQSSGMVRLTNAFGIAGLVKFFNGFYMIIIKSRQKVGSLRGGSIYKIMATDMIYLPSSSVIQDEKLEQKYLKSFQCIDLSTDFYYSVELNLTQTWPECFENPAIHEKYCWNGHMITQLPMEWRIVSIHGFVGSRRLSADYQSPELLLIARRSCKYAGTRFNRRGQSLTGDVANEARAENLE